MQLLREGLDSLLQLFIFLVDRCQHTEKRGQLKGLKFIPGEYGGAFSKLFLSYCIFLLKVVYLSYFSLGICPFIFEIAFNAVKDINGLLKILQCFWELSLEFISNANVVHNPCIICVSLPVFEQ